MCVCVCVHGCVLFFNRTILLQKKPLDTKVIFISSVFQIKNLLITPIQMIQKLLAACHSKYHFVLAIIFFSHQIGFLLSEEGIIVIKQEITFHVG